MVMTDDELRKAVARGRLAGIPDSVIAVQLGAPLGTVQSMKGGTPAPEPPKTKTADEIEMERLEAVIEQRRATMPGRK